MTYEPRYVGGDLEKKICNLLEKVLNKIQQYENKDAILRLIHLNNEIKGDEDNKVEVILYVDRSTPRAYSTFLKYVKDEEKFEVMRIGNLIVLNNVYLMIKPDENRRTLEVYISSYEY